jgi:protein TonB
MQQPGSIGEIAMSCAPAARGGGRVCAGWAGHWVVAGTVSVLVHAAVVVAVVRGWGTMVEGPTVSLSSGPAGGRGEGLVIRPESTDSIATPAELAMTLPVMPVELPRAQEEPDVAVPDPPVESALETVSLKLIGVGPRAPAAPEEIVPHLRDGLPGPRLRAHLPVDVSPVALSDVPATGANAHGKATGARSQDAPAPRGSGEGASSGSGQSDIVGGIDGRAIPRPIYPAESRQRGEQGTVVLEVTFHADGTLGAIRVVSDAGFPRLGEAAVEAMKRAPVSPPRVDGKPIEAVVRVPFEFKLR